MKKSTALSLIFILGILPLSVQAYTVLPLRHRFDITRDFLQPTDVAVGKNNDIYIMDGVNNRVKVFDEQGRFKLSFGSKGDRKGKFNNPVGITTDSSGRVYVADTGNSRIQIFSSDGTFERQIAMSAGDGNKPPEPVDVAVDESLQRMYIADNDNHQVLVYSNPGDKLLSAWGSKGSRDHQFRYPFLIAAGNNASVFIIDVLNTRVQVWRNDKPAGSIGGWGVDLGKLYRPKGVCVDKDGLVFVSDSVLGVIQTFSSNGDFKAVLGNEKGDVRKWKTPLGITIDSRQRLYVVEMIPNRVGVYDILSDQKIEKQFKP
jgi:DNA-binding beta-propeller fold protein YncE